MKERFDNEMLELAAARIREGNLREIERAIDRIKQPQSVLDDWFRKQWYRAAWRRRKQRWSGRTQHVKHCGGVSND